MSTKSSSEDKGKSSALRDAVNAFREHKHGKGKVKQSMIMNIFMTIFSGLKTVLLKLWNINRFKGIRISMSVWKENHKKSVLAIVVILVAVSVAFFYKQPIKDTMGSMYKKSVAVADKHYTNLRKVMNSDKAIAESDLNPGETMESVKNFIDDERVKIVAAAQKFMDNERLKIMTASMELVQEETKKAVELFVAKERERVTLNELAMMRKMQLAIQWEKDQIVSYEKKGVTVIYNKDEDRLPDLYQGRFIKWAKGKYDGIVLGQIMPEFEGGFKFTTYDGRNLVPMKYVVEKLKSAGCTNVISLMENKFRFPLPAPFTDQINGSLHVYERHVKFAGILPLGWKKEMVFTDDEGNFHVVMSHNGKMKGGITTETPWQMNLSDKEE